MKADTFPENTLWCFIANTFKVTKLNIVYATVFENNPWHVQWYLYCYQVILLKMNITYKRTFQFEVLNIVCEEYWSEQ